MKRVSIADIMRETGLSRATIDRVLNRRGNVHQRTKDLVERAMRILSAHPDRDSPDSPKADIVLRLGRGMTAQMRAAWDLNHPQGMFHDLYQAEEHAVHAVVEALCADLSRPLILCVKNTDRLADLLHGARVRGKRVIAIVSDLAAHARDVFLGIDNRAAGQTAAYLIGRALGERPASVGVVLGNLAFRCHEDREIGFRTALRAHFPRIALSAEAQGEDHADLTRAAVLRLLNEQPSLSAIYNVGGGNSGLIAAIRDAGKAQEMLVVTHEVNSVTIPLMRDGAIDYCIASDPGLLIAEALRLCGEETLAPRHDAVHYDFGVYTRFNIPQFK